MGFVDSVRRRVLGEIDVATMESELWTSILLLLGATLLSAIFTFVMRQTIIVVSRRIEFDLKNEIFRIFYTDCKGYT